MTQRTIVIASFVLFAAVLLWGGYSLIIYLGLPIHQLVYMTPDQVQTWDIACDQQMSGAARNSINFCRGAAVIVPFVQAVLAMASPFLGYTILSLAALGAVLLYSGYKTGRFELKTEWRPAVIIFLFVASVWMIATTFSLGTLYNANTPDGFKITDVSGQKILPPFRRFFEPTERVYSGAGPEALEELQNNYQTLLARGCLDDTGVMTQNGAKLFNLSFWCMQGSLFSRAGTQIVLVLFFLFNLLILGRCILVHCLRLKEVPDLALLGFSLGTGALGWVAILWLLTILGQLQSGAVRTLFIGMPLLLLPHSVWWLKKAWHTRFEVDLSVKNWHIYLTWLLLTYVALNFLNVVRPFPIGWDDLGSYLNRPRLLSSYGSFIPSMSQFQWEYLTSLGFLLFGYDSWTGSAFAMQINWTAGLIAVLTVYTIGRLYFGKKGGVLSAMVYYFLPMTGHFSFADMKIDNASFFTTALAVLAVLLYFFPPEEEGRTEPRHPDLKLLVVAGLLAGFSFAIKPTAVLGILMAFTMITGASLGVFGAAGAVLIGFAVLQQFGALNVVDVSSRAELAVSVSKLLFTGITFLIGAAGVGYAAYKNRVRAVPYLTSLGLFAAGIASACLPWMMYNVWYSGHWSTATMLAAQDKTASLVFYLQQEEVDAMKLPPEQKVRALTPELKLDPNHPACKTSARTEELDRYWGFNKGLSHYLTLPWRQVMNLDTFGYYVTFAPALLLFILLLLNPVLWSQKWQKFHIAAAGAVCVLIVHSLLSLMEAGWYTSIVGWFGGFAVGRLLGYLILSLFAVAPFTALLWRHEVRWLGFLFVGTWIFIIQWALVANGIAWYGIGMFLGIAVALEAMARYAPDSPNRWLVNVLIGASILICLANRLWQFDTQKNLFEYPLGKITATALREVTIPDYDDIREYVVTRRETMPDTPYTYRVGTFISYFIPKNREIFPLADHQLNMFSCMNQERNHALTLRRLQKLGFNSIIFDTNTHTIEKDPNGSLHQKVQKFLDFANDPALNLELVVNDPGNGIAYILLPPPTASGGTLQAPAPLK
jgi:hypothetical protein